MFLTIVSKDGDRITNKKWVNYADRIDLIKGLLPIFKDKDQYERFIDWAWETIPYSEAKARVENLGYEVWEGDSEYGQEIPQTISRFAIWRRVDACTRKPEQVEFEGIKLKIRVS